MLILGDNVFEANLEDVVRRQQENRTDAALSPGTKPPGRRL